MKQFIERLFQQARAAGFDQCEVYATQSDSFRVNIFNGEIDDYAVHETLGVGFRGLVEGKLGYAYGEATDGDAAAFLVNSALQNARLLTGGEPALLYPGGGSYPALDQDDAAVRALDARAKIDLAQEMYRAMRACDPRIVSSRYCQVSTGAGHTWLYNSLGLALEQEDGMLAAFALPVAKQGEEMTSGLAFAAGRDPGAVDPGAIARLACERALAQLGAAPLPSGRMPVILRFDAMADLLSTFSGVFSADNAQKGLSLLAGKEGQAVASEAVTIVDDPLYPGGLSASAFDGEGVPTHTKAVVRRGELTTLLHNLKTAAKAGVETTGNAARASAASPVTISPFHFYIQPGSQPLEALAAQAGRGLVVTELEGLHAGANPVSGDFSLACRGFAVEGGRIGRPVNQVTLSGNFFQLLRNVAAVGSDLTFDMPGSACFGSPSVLVGEMSVSGT